MKSTRVAHLPDVLLTYPPGTMVLWKAAYWATPPGKRKGKKREIHYNYIPGRVFGKSPHQGNKRIVLDVMYIGVNPFGERYLAVIRKPAISIDHVISLPTWWAMRAAEREGR